MLTGIAGVSFVASKGDVVEVDDESGKRLISASFAEPTEPPTEAEKAAAEAAEAEAAEKAAAAKPKGKGK